MAYHSMIDLITAYLFRLSTVVDFLASGSMHFKKTAIPDNQEHLCVQ